MAKRSPLAERLDEVRDRIANAAVSELVQHYVLPHRSGDAYDSVADLVGVTLGAWAGFRAVRRRT